MSRVGKRQRACRYSRHASAVLSLLVKNRQQCCDTALVWSIRALRLTGLRREAEENRDREGADVNRARSGSWVGVFSAAECSASVRFLLRAFDLSNLTGSRDNQGESLANRTR